MATSIGEIKTEFKECEIASLKELIEKYTDDNGEWYLRTKGDANDFVDQILIRDYMV